MTVGMPNLKRIRIFERGNMSYSKMKILRKITAVVFVVITVLLVYGYILGGNYDAYRGLISFDEARLLGEERLPIALIVVAILFFVRLVFHSRFESRQIGKMSDALVRDCDLKKYIELTEGVSPNASFSASLAVLVNNRAIAFALLDNKEAANDNLALLEKWYFTQKHKTLIAWIGSLLCSVASSLDDNNLVDTYLSRLSAFVDESKAKSIYMKSAIATYRSLTQRQELMIAQDYEGLLTWIDEQVKRLDSENMLKRVLYEYQKARILKELGRKNEAIECLKYVIANGSQLKQVKEAKGILNNEGISS